MSIIAHLDLDAFFCAVEELFDPSLRGTAFAVGGDPNKRGVVATCSYPARAHGVRSAMPMSKALRLCPTLKIVHRRHNLYGQISKKVMQKIRALNVPVEQISIDEAFFDLTNLENPEETARELQNAILQDLHLPCSVGLASNKLVAKIANEVGKASAKRGVPPRAFTVVPSGTEAEFLAPLAVQKLWGIGPKTAERLNRMGIRTLGELAKQDELVMLRLFGQNGYEMTRRARGIDTRQLVTHRERKSISQEKTFSHDKQNGDDLRRILRSQAEQISDKLKKKGLLAQTVKIKLRWSDFTTLTRQTTLPTPSDDADLIIQTALSLFSAHWQDGRALRLLGAGLSGLKKKQEQIGLWDKNWAKERQMTEAIDELQERFGKNAITRGVKKPDS